MRAWLWLGFLMLPSVFVTWFLADVGLHPALWGLWAWTVEVWLFGAIVAVGWLEDL